MSSSFPVYLGATPVNIRTGGSGGTRVNARADPTPSDAWGECCVREGVVFVIFRSGGGWQHVIFELKIVSNSRGERRELQSSTGRLTAAKIFRVESWGKLYLLNQVSPTSFVGYVSHGNITTGNAGSTNVIYKHLQ